MGVIKGRHGVKAQCDASTRRVKWIAKMVVRHQ